MTVNGTDAEKGECEGPRVSFGFSESEITGGLGKHSGAVGAEAGL